MANLTDKEKRELLMDAGSASRRAEFARLDARLVQLAPNDYLNFLTASADWFGSVPFRSIVGNMFLL